LGSTIQQGKCDRSSRDGNIALTRFVHRLVYDVQKLSQEQFQSEARPRSGQRFPAAPLRRAPVALLHALKH
jgi:hypothetical protein